MENYPPQEERKERNKDGKQNRCTVATPVFTIQCRKTASQEVVLVFLQRRGLVFSLRIYQRGFRRVVLRSAV
ncbi:hypothetical protein CEXT_801991 [Caerostris extrusa]|uniref:Uncharacterized protein n=1 Tax=Caerostris extrusa TaxID=172846 RepID=A0AAV4UNV5_CAEEX|nr:hypothetical protein CEXT_801991 [Caerostris extrusa]